MAPSSSQLSGPELRDARQLADAGTRLFHDVMHHLPDEDFARPSRLPGWSRAHVIAHLGFNAEALLRLVGWASTGIEAAMYPSTEARNSQIDSGAVLAPALLREHSERAAVELANGWDRLTPENWNARVRTNQGVDIPATTTVWLRTREVWLHAVDLDNGATFDDFPGTLVDHLMADVLANWRGRREAESLPNIVLTPTDRDSARGVGTLDDPDAITVMGSASHLVAWATGRGHDGVSLASGGEAPAAPRWL